jgi:hypothetical protein
MNTPTPLQSLPPQPYPYSPQGYPQLNRTAGPVKVFGIIYAILAVLSLLGFFVLLALAFLPALASHDLSGSGLRGAAIPTILFGFLAVIIGIITALQAATGYGLLTLKPWGRTLGIVTAIISCLSIPVGTILGGLTLFFLLREGADQECDRLAAARTLTPNP